MGLLLLFPLSSDPLAKIPEERLRGWPLSRGQWIGLRVGSLAFSPVLWITLVLLLRASSVWFGLEFLGLCLGMYALTSVFSGVAARAPRLDPLRWLPPFGSAIGGLVRKNLRELLTILDPYVGLALTVATLLFRGLSPEVPPDAVMVMSMVVVMSLATYALCLFGLDTSAGFTRYHLLPLRGWQILLAKDIAFFVVLLPLVLCLQPLPGIAAGLMALTVGHQQSTRNFVAQSRWRFTSGAAFLPMVAQTILMFSAGTMVARTSVWIMVACVAAWAGSLWYFGRDLDHGAE